MHSNPQSSASAPRHRQHRPWVIGAAVAGLLLLGLTWALLDSPGWYDPPHVPEAERQAVRNNLISAQQAFTDSLVTEQRPFVYHIYEEDVNRWLAMRREIFPPLDESLPEGVSDPLVRFAADRIRIAATWRGSGPSVVASIDLVPTFEQDHVSIRADAVRCGRLPAPIGWLKEWLVTSIDRPPDATWPGSPSIQGNLLDGLRIGAEAWWKNGGRTYRLIGLSVQPGRLDLTIQPEGRRASSRRSDQD